MPATNTEDGTLTIVATEPRKPAKSRSLRHKRFGVRGGARRRTAWEQWMMSGCVHPR